MLLFVFAAHLGLIRQTIWGDGETRAEMMQERLLSANEKPSVHSPSRYPALTAIFALAAIIATAAALYMWQASGRR